MHMKKAEQKAPSIFTMLMAIVLALGIGFMPNAQYAFADDVGSTGEGTVSTVSFPDVTDETPHKADIEWLAANDADKNIVSFIRRDKKGNEIIALIKGLLENKVSLYADELNALVFAELKISRPSDKLAEFIGECINLGVSKNIFVRSISDRISLY